MSGARRIAVLAGGGSALCAGAVLLVMNGSEPADRRHPQVTAPVEAGRPTEAATGRSAQASPVVRQNSAGRMDPRAVTRVPTRRCREVRIADSGARRLASVPPIPRLMAVSSGPDGITVGYGFAAYPARCRPVRLLITAHSVDRIANASRLVVPARPTGEVNLPVPMHAPGPYEVRISAVTASGAMSPATTVPVVER